MVFIILIILIILLLYYINIRIKFNDKHTTDNIVKYDIDGYKKGFSLYDWRARKFKWFDSPGIDIKLDEKLHLIKHCMYIDYKLLINGYLNIAMINWKISLCHNNHEQSLPHTRGDIIFLPIKYLYNDNLNKILIHEKMHVFQKYNKKLVQKYIHDHGYINTGLYDKLYRSNPDTDKYIYIKNNKFISDSYNNESPENIYDNIYDAPIHPLEKMAYNIEQIL